jgi:hypothetical protein
MWLSYNAGQIFVVVICCLIIIGLVVWLFTDINKSVKSLGKKGKKKSVTFGENKVKEFESEE